MRLFNTTFVVLAATLFASGTAVSNADQISVSNVGVVHSSHVLAGEDKRFLRSHQMTDDEGKLPKHDEEERKGGANLFTALKLSNMKSDNIYRFMVFKRWQKYGYSADDVYENVPKSLYDAYKIHIRKNP